MQQLDRHNSCRQSRRMGEDIRGSNKAQVVSLISRFLAICQQKELLIAREFGVTVSERRCLEMFLPEAEHSIKELSAGLGIAASRLSRILDRLEDRGLVIRTIDHRDRRTTRVTLSAEGADLARRLSERVSQAYGPIVGLMLLESQQTTISFFRQVVDSFGSR